MFLFLFIDLTKNEPGTAELRSRKACGSSCKIDGTMHLWNSARDSRNDRHYSASLRLGITRPA